MSIRDFSTEDLLKELDRRNEEQRLERRILFVDIDGVKDIMFNPTCILNSWKVLDEATIKIVNGEIQLY